MKKSTSLKKNYEYKKVLLRGTKYRGKYLEISIIKNDEKNKNINFIGIAIRKKAGKAVKRNKLKRIIRENYRIIEDRIKYGYSIVFLLRRQQDIKNTTFNNIKNDLTELFKKANLYENREL